MPRVLEICLVPRTPVASQYPGVYLFSSAARMVRPVTNLSCSKVEMIGSFEQVYMDIAITPGEAVQGVSPITRGGSALEVLSVTLALHLGF